MEDRRLLRATFTLALVPLVGGLGIFFSWWIGKAWFLTNLNDLEFWGFLWIPVSGFMAVIGLITGMMYVWDADRKTIWKGLLALGCILSNIPAVAWVLHKQEDIDNRAYVRIYNQTGSPITSLTISNSLYTEQLAENEADDNVTGYFYPNYDEFDSGEPQMEEVTLRVTAGEQERVLILPVIYKGECTSLILNGKFEIEE